jgi:Flp pilus assembly protein TadB
VRRMDLKRLWRSNRHMRLAGFLLLPAGWALVIAALILLAASGPRTAFVLAGFAVEVLGFALLTRSHMPPRRERS